MSKGQREMTYEELKYAYMKKVQRVQELEMENKSLNHILGEHIVACEQMEKKIKRYREALEFYADEETYETKFATDTDEIFDPFTLIELDEGKKARRALEGEE